MKMKNIVRTFHNNRLKKVCIIKWKVLIMLLGCKAVQQMWKNGNSLK